MHERFAPGAYDFVIDPSGVTDRAGNPVGGDPIRRSFDVAQFDAHFTSPHTISESETMSSGEEVAAAVAGAAPTGLPVVCTMTFDTAGRTMMGLTPEAAAEFCQALTPTPAAIGANCGTGPAELVNAMNGLARMAAPGSVLVAKGNCGIPGYHDGQIRYDGTPELMAHYARLACDSGARIIGACCGSTPDHLRAITDALDGYQPKDAPDVAAIEANLGPLSSATIQTGRKLASSSRRTWSWP